MKDESNVEGGLIIIIRQDLKGKEILIGVQTTTGIL